MKFTREPFRVLLPHARGVLVRDAPTMEVAQTIADHWKAEHGSEAKICRWNSDDQRYLLVGGGGK